MAIEERQPALAHVSHGSMISVSIREGLALLKHLTVC